MRDDEHNTELALDLESLLARPDISVEERRELAEIAGRLAAADYSGESRARQALRRRLVERAAARAGTPRGALPTLPSPVRTLAVALLVLAVLVTAALATPPGRALAQDVLRRVGQVILSPAQPEPLQPPGTAPVREPEVSPVPTQPAPGSVPPLYTPAYIPAGYTYVANIERYVRAGSADPARPDFFAIYAPRFNGTDPHEWPIGDATLREVTVRGRPGIYVEHAPLILTQDAQGHWHVAGYVNLLVWEEGGITVSVESNVLGAEELQKIAESLEKR